MKKILPILFLAVLNISCASNPPPKQTVETKTVVEKTKMIETKEAIAKEVKPTKIEKAKIIEVEEAIAKEVKPAKVEKAKIIEAEEAIAKETKPTKIEKAKIIEAEEAIAKEAKPAIDKELQTKSPCLQQPNPGRCRAAFQKYYYDTKTEQCSQFLWGGCGGSVPFHDMESCQQQCGAQQHQESDAPKLKKKRRKLFQAE